MGCAGAHALALALGSGEGVLVDAERAGCGAMTFDHCRSGRESQPGDPAGQGSVSLGPQAPVGLGHSPHSIRQGHPVADVNKDTDGGI